MRICQTFENVFKKSRFLTYKYFCNEGILKGAICKILNRYEKSGTAKYKAHAGRKAILASKKLLDSVEKMFIENTNLSERAAASKLGISKTYLHKIKTEKLEFKTYKATSVPKYNERQKASAKKNCRKISENFLKSKLEKIVVMDDETYCTMDPENINGVKFYS